MKKSIAKNFTFNLIYQVLTILLPLITTPYLSRVLGSEPIGIYGYTLSITTYFVLFGSLGISMYGQREIAKVQNNKNKYSKAFWEIIIIRVISIVISLSIYWLSVCMYSQYSLYYKIFSLYILAYAFDINWLFQGLENFSKTVVRNIIVKLLSIVFIFCFVKTPNDLWIYILIFVLSELLGNISIWLYLPKYLVKINFKELKYKKHLKPIGSLFLPQVATQIYTVLDKPMVGAITHNMSEVGFYEQAQKIARAALVIVSSLQTVMNSRVANASAKNDKNEISLCLKKSFDFVWFFGMLLVCGIIGVSSNLVPWYYGEGFEGVGPILMATAPIVLVIGLSGITGIVYLVQTGQQKVLTKSVILGAIVNVCANIVLIKFFNGVGAAIASVLAEVVILVYHLFYIKKIYRIRDIFSVSCKSLISGALMLIVLLIIGPYFSPSIMNTILLSFIGTSIYLVALLILKYDFLYRLINQIIVIIKKYINNYLKRGI